MNYSVPILILTDNKCLLVEKVKVKQLVEVNLVTATPTYLTVEIISEYVISGRALPDDRVIIDNNVFVFAGP